MLTTKTSDTAEDMDIISNNGDSGEEDVVLDNAAPVKKRKKLIRLRQIDDSDASDSDGGGGKHNDIKNNEISSNNEHLVSEIDIQDKESVGVPRESPALKPSEKNVTPNDEVKSSKDVASKTPTRIADTESPKPENPTPAANKSNTAQKSQIKTSTQAPSYVKMAKKNTSNPFAFAAAGKAGKAKAKKSAKNTGKLTSFFAAKDSGKAAANETSEKETAKTKSESVENAPVTSPTTKSSIVVKTTETDTPKSADSHTTKTTASVSVENGVSVQEKMKESIATTKGTLKNVSVDESDLKAVTPVKGEDYDPTAVKYHPIKSACWAKGKDVPFLAVCKVFDAIENDSGRHAKQNILSNLYRSIIVLSPEQLADTVHLTMNRLGPSYEGLELGIGEGLIKKLLAETTGQSQQAIRDSLQLLGDLGKVAETKKATQSVLFKPKALSVPNVYKSYVTLAKMSGDKVQRNKSDKIKSMMVAGSSLEAKYVVRAMQGKLRIGLAEKIVLAALAQAYTMTPPVRDGGKQHLNRKLSMSEDKYREEEDKTQLLIRTAHCEMPNLAKIVNCLITDGADALPEKCHMLPGIPVEPMLANPTKGVSEILTRFEDLEFTSEYKYDGERAQVHLMDNGTMRIYSRNLENNTSKYPDVIDKIRQCFSPEVKNFIIDAEAVAYDIEAKRILPFQVLSTRKRKNVENGDEVKVQVQLFAFDLLYLNDKPYVTKPFHTRRAALHKHFTPQEGSLAFATSMDANSVDEIQAFLDKSIEDSCEGLMIKTLYQDATYEIANRSKKWLKLKKDYIEDGGLGDSFDLVVIGAWYGQGKRTGWYAAYLLACYNEDEEEYQAICKVGTGMTNEFLKDSNEFFAKHLSESGKKAYYRTTESSKPDVWFEPVQVWEIKAADLSISPAYLAGVGEVHPTKGISLRFPRVLRIRDDKKPDEATSSSRIAEMYSAQPLVQQNGPPRR